MKSFDGTHLGHRDASAMDLMVCCKVHDGGGDDDNGDNDDGDGGWW
jgi:hypothetical protein